MRPFAQIVTTLLLFLTVVLTNVRQTESDEVLASPPKSAVDGESEARQLPRKDQDWQTIRAKNLLYVDKTSFLVKLLVTSRKLCFLTRPRQFGKSLFVDMMADFFRGKKAQFKGLAVERTGNSKYFAERMPKSVVRKMVCKIGQLFCPHFSAWPKWMEFPVVNLNFAEITNFDTLETFENVYRQRLGEILASYKIDIKLWTSLDMSAVIKALHRKFNGLPVIVLVDEYDHPFQYAFRTLRKPSVAGAVQNYLNGIFVQIKNNAQYLGLAFVTGVSKLGSSALENGDDNAFVDLTYDQDFAAAFGLSADEIDANFKAHVEEFARCTSNASGGASENGTERAAERTTIMKRLRSWYDGYHFSLNITNGSRVLNPISTMDSLRNHKFDSYWCSGESIDYLVERLYEEKSVWRVDSFRRGVDLHKSKLFRRHDRLKGDVPLPAWMLLSGYATIARYDRETRLVTIGYPNFEIEESVRESVAEYAPSKKKYIGQCGQENEMLFKGMKEGNFRAAFEVMRDYEFTPLSHPPTDGATPPEITRRIRKILSGAGIAFREGVAFKNAAAAAASGHDGRIDFLTLNLDRNCAISVKCDGGGTVVNAIGQLIEYVNASRNDFTEAVKKVQVNSEAMYFVGVGFVHNDAGQYQLADWIALPYANGKLQYKRVRADLEALKEKFLKIYAPHPDTGKNV